MFSGEFGEIGATSGLFSEVSCTCSDVFLCVVVSNAKKNVTGVYLSWGLILRNVCVVVLTDFIVGDGQAIKNFCLVNEEKTQLSFFRNFIIGGFFFIEKVDVFIGSFCFITKL